MSRKWIVRGITVLLLVGLGLGAGAWGWWQWALKPYSPAGKMEVLAVMPGTTARQVGLELERRHLIHNAWVFGRLAHAQQVDNRLLSGEYYVSANMSSGEIIKLLLKGPDIEIVRVTIPEGYNTEQIINVLVQKGLGSKEDLTKVIASDAFPYSFLDGAPAGIHRLEGFLFPDTYFFKKGTNPHTVIDAFLQRFNRELLPEVKTQLGEAKLSIHDWVTLASIVEKEAEKQEDRPVIASVFINRLDKKMKLESCATVQFVLGTPKPKLYDKDLQTPSPYNTYLHGGLPPGPISNPGHASLQAVLHPAQTDYLYFLAKSDGYHVFAKTFGEHLQNQRLYQ
ncbi:MAG: endolytic transglycosylase MltG [Desulfitobacteriaceae bacterium]